MAQVFVGTCVITGLDLSEIQTTADVLACVYDEMKMYTTAFHAFVYANIVFKMFFKEVCTKAVKAAARLFNVLHVVGESECKESALFDSKRFNELFYVQL
ncbi:hypothetical protein NX87_11340 [Neisseria meningitidis]|nr:hypothetical protein NX87_11340 [Neisseria meningitidis]